MFIWIFGIVGPMANHLQAETSRPNFVIVLADDMTWFDCEPYGSPNVKTPHMQRLADEGMTFTNMFTATAMCAPTRQQLYTGVYPIRSGAFPNHSKVHNGVKSMVHHLSDLGYTVSLQGKTHFGPEPSFPFKRKKMKDVVGSTQPFCHIFASHNPHKPWTSGDASQFDPDQLVLPPNLIDTPHTREVLCQYYAEIVSLDQELGAIMQQLDTAGVADNTVLIFTSEQGMTLPFGGKWLCYDTGLKTAFIVRWPGAVAPGTTSNALTQYVDVVPTLVDIAGGEPQTVTIGRPDADGNDGFDGKSFKAILTGEQSELREVVFGVHTTRAILNGDLYPIRSVRNHRYQYIKNLNSDDSFTNAYTSGGKYFEDFYQPLLQAAEQDPAIKQRLEFFQQRPAEEFYDLEADPYNLNNITDDPSITAIKQELSAQLDGWMQQQGDLGIETEMTAKKKGGGGKKKK